MVLNLAFDQPAFASASASAPAPAPASTSTSLGCYTLSGPRGHLNFTPWKHIMQANRGLHVSSGQGQRHRAYPVNPGYVNPGYAYPVYSGSTVSSFPAGPAGPTSNPSTMRGSAGVRAPAPSTEEERPTKRTRPSPSHRVTEKKHREKVIDSINALELMVNDKDNVDAQETLKEATKRRLAGRAPVRSRRAGEAGKCDVLDSGMEAIVALRRRAVELGGHLGGVGQAQAQAPAPETAEDTMNAMRAMETAGAQAEAEAAALNAALDHGPGPSQSSLPAGEASQGEGSASASASQEHVQNTDTSLAAPDNQAGGTSLDWGFEPDEVAGFDCSFFFTQASFCDA